MNGTAATTATTCGKAAGLWCRRPSGHRASDLHADRKIEADRMFMEQHGPMAAIIHAASGWLVSPRGRARD